MHVNLGDHDRLTYPVGSGVQFIKPCVTNYVKALHKIYTDDFFFINNRINLWCRGSSGAILATAFTLLWDVPNTDFAILHIKKPDEKSHSGKPYYFFDSYALNIVIDDFIETGNTIRAILDHIKDIESIDMPDVLMVETRGTRFLDDFKHIISN